MAQRKPPVIETFTCPWCGNEWTRQGPRGGPRPKWCSRRCADLAKLGRRGTCERCGADYYGFGARFCSAECAHFALRRNSAVDSLQPKVTPRARADFEPLRKAHRESDPEAFITALGAICSVSEAGCWLWPSIRNGKGYPVLNIDRRRLAVHRLALEARLRAPLGSMPAHHICANVRCVRPDHLQAVTPEENTAEMMARQAYLARIGALETALAEVAPGHPLLSDSPVTP